MGREGEPCPVIAGDGLTQVTVPSVVGLHIRVASEAACAAGLKLAQTDPDGPPLAALTWPGDFWITAQHSPPGRQLWRWDALVVEWTPREPAGVREPRRPKPAADFGAAELPTAEPD
jgi:hypothetical protein